jgi:hypothetical protein
MIQPPLIVLAFAKGEAAEDALGLGFELIGAELGVFPLRLVILLGVGVAGALAFAQDGLEPPVLGRDRGGELEHGFIAGRRGFLRQVTERGVAIEHHAAGVRLGRAQDDGEKRRLARAVRTDQRDALAHVNGKRHIFEQRARAEAFANLGQGQHERGSLRAVTRARKVAANRKRCGLTQALPEWKA